MAEPLFRFPVKDNDVRVIDGDTIKVLLDRGFGDRKLVSVRVFGTDAPESRTRQNLQERYAGKLVGLVSRRWFERLEPDRCDGPQQR